MNVTQLQVYFKNVNSISACSLVIRVLEEVDILVYRRSHRKTQDVEHYRDRQHDQGLLGTEPGEIVHDSSQNTLQHGELKTKIYRCIQIHVA